MSEFMFPELSHQILGLAFDVHRSLGPGLLEKVYENAMIVELSLAGLSFEKQKSFPVVYKGQSIGVYIADLVVENKFILELKSVQDINNVHMAQIINYLKISKIPVGYLFNFHNPKLVWKRYISTPLPP